MFKHNLYYAIRNFFKKKNLSLVKIAGLSLGMASCFIILAYVNHELSFDTFHEQYDRIVRCYDYRHIGESDLEEVHEMLPHALAPSIKENVPGIKDFFRIHPDILGCSMEVMNENNQKKAFREEKIYFTDPSFLTYLKFDFAFLNAKEPLSKPNTIILTGPMAKKYFGSKNPLGKTIEVSGGYGPGVYEVIGVLKDLPHNTHFDFDFLMPMENLLQRRQYQRTEGWTWYNFYVYFILDQAWEDPAFKTQMNDALEKYAGSFLDFDSNNKLVFQEISELHLKALAIDKYTRSKTENTVAYFVIIAFFVLIIAWINYINLSTARANDRAREVVIRKTIGAGRINLLGQFFTESILINLVSLIIGVILALLLLPVLEQFAGLSFGFNLWSKPLVLIALLLVFVFGAVLSGWYPAVVLSSFRVTSVMQANAPVNSGKQFLRKSLVVFQFVVSTSMIIAIFVIYKQMSFVSEADLGLNTKNILIVRGPHKLGDRDECKEKLLNLKEELKNHSRIKAVASTVELPGGKFSQVLPVTRPEFSEVNYPEAHSNFVDIDFLETYGIKCLSGSNWLTSSENEKTNILINETARRLYDFPDNESALGKTLILGGRTFHIHAVVEDFNWSSLKTEIEPMVFKLTLITASCFSVHLDKIDRDIIEFAGERFLNYFPDNPYLYFDLEEQIDSQYEADRFFRNIFLVFALLGVFIAVLGLYGLASYTCLIRRKEMAIRKVLGASRLQVAGIFYSYFSKLIMSSCLIALPLSYFGVRKWLNTFVYKIDMDVWMFLIPLFILGLVSMLVVGWEVYKISASSPAEAVKE